MVIRLINRCQRNFGIIIEIEIIDQQRVRYNACLNATSFLSQLINPRCSSPVMHFRLPNGHINFEKFWQLAKQVTEFIAWKQVACPFEKNPRVIAFLQASPVLTENSKQYLFYSIVKVRKCVEIIEFDKFLSLFVTALALASFECEPPDNNPEKERYKALK